MRLLAAATRSVGAPPTAVASVTGPMPESVRPTRPFVGSTNQRFPSPGPGASAVGLVAAPAIATGMDCTPPSETPPTVPVALNVTLSPVAEATIPVGVPAESHS